MRAGQRGHAGDAQRRRADAGDFRAHLVQQGGQVGDLRLAGGVVDDGIAMRQAGCHQRILGRADGDFLEHDLGALQAAGGGFGDHIPILQRDAGAQCFHRLQVQVHRPCADGATARQRHFRIARARQQRPQHLDGSAHGAYQLVRRYGLAHLGHLKRKLPAILPRRADLHRPAFRRIVQSDACAQLHQQLRHGGDVGEIGHIIEGEGFIRQQAGAHQLQRRVLGPANDDFPGQGPPPDDAQTIHRSAVLAPCMRKRQ